MGHRDEGAKGRGVFSGGLSAAGEPKITFFGEAIFS
jgi:hypothetical protein